MGVFARNPHECLDESELLAFADGRGSAGVAGAARPREAVEAHLAGCSECRTLLSALAQSASVVQVKSGTAFAQTEFGGNATMRIPSPEAGMRSEPPPASGGASRPSRPPASGGIVSPLASPVAPSAPPASGDGAAFAALAASAAVVSIGDVLDAKYRVDGVLGVGGMGVVVAAHHLALGQSFAIKFLHPHIARQGEAKARFLREARAAAQLRGEHVVRVTDTGTFDLPVGPGVPFLVMELLDGQSLGTLLRSRRRFTVDESVLYMLQAAEALAEAHRIGIVHRDLKPDNLFLARRADGTPFVKVVDFGISKTRAEEALSLTSQNAIMGTPRYMAPEQMRSSKDVDARADVWSLGAILYELLAGAPPFDAPTITELITQVQLAPHVPLAMRAPGLTPDLAAVVEACLVKDPAARLRDVLSLARALRSVCPPEGRVHIERIERLFGQGSDASARASSPPPSLAPAVAPAPPPRLRLWHIALGALGLGIALGAVVLAALPRGEAAPPPGSLGLASVSAPPPASAAPDLADPALLPLAAGPATVPAPQAKAGAPRPGRADTSPRLPVAATAPPPSAAPTLPPVPSSAPPALDPHGLRSRN
jgi:serine/threonine-protein kinase